eukprot:7400467-Ditylum_brightwellii.AAC.1
MPLIRMTGRQIASAKREKKVHFPFTCNSSIQITKFKQQHVSDKAISSIIGKEHQRGGKKKTCYTSRN